jgi:hypothetical protein
VDVQKHIQERQADIDELSKKDPKRAAYERSKLADEAKQMTLDSRRGVIEQQIDRFTVPAQQDAGAEPDPYQFVPADKAKEWKDALKNADQTRIDQVDDQIRKAREEHSHKLAVEDARGLSLQRIDQHFQKFADMQAQFGDLGTSISPYQWETARAKYHMIASDPQISTAGIEALEKDIYSDLKPQKDEKPGKETGKLTMPQALSEARQILKDNGEAPTVPRMQFIAQQLMNVQAEHDQAGASQSAPAQAPAKNGKVPLRGMPEPDEPTAPPAPVKDIRGAVEKLPADQKKRAADAARAKAAGWSFEEYQSYLRTGKVPKGKTLK